MTVPYRLKFKSNCRHFIQGRGTLFMTVTNQVEPPNFTYAGEMVEINGKEFLCNGVERHCIGGDYPKGWPIGVLVKEFE